MAKQEALIDATDTVGPLFYGVANQVPKAVRKPSARRVAIRQLNFRTTALVAMGTLTYALLGDLDGAVVQPSGLALGGLAANAFRALLGDKQLRAHIHAQSESCC